MAWAPSATATDISARCIFGNHKYEIFEIAADWLYQLELLEAEEEFWIASRREGRRWRHRSRFPLKPVGIREVCLEGNNSWASAAVDWLQDRDAATYDIGYGDTMGQKEFAVRATDTDERSVVMQCRTFAKTQLQWTPSV